MASGETTAESCAFGVRIPMSSGENKLFEVEGLVLDLLGGIDVLIGMDIITQGSFKIDFDGKVTFCIKA